MITCVITLEPITQTNGILIKVIRGNTTCVYCLDNIELLNKLSSCPLTRHVGSYHFIKLSTLTAQQFNTLSQLDDNNDRDRFFDHHNFSQQTGQFNASLVDRSGQHIANFFFSNWLNGLAFGIACSVTSTLLIRTLPQFYTDAAGILFDKQMEDGNAILLPLEGLAIGFMCQVLEMNEYPLLRANISFLFLCWVVFNTLMALVPIPNPSDQSPAMAYTP